MTDREYKNIRFNLENRIATITINRPEVANAMDHDTFTEVHEAFNWCGESPEVGVIVLTGAGKNFSAGGNLKNFKKVLDEGGYIHKEQVEYAAEVAWDIHNNPKPTIAMINGTAAGAGAAIAAACDFRVFGKESRFVMAFINVGLSGDTGCMYYLSKLVGIAKGLEIMMTGEAVDAKTALEIGLATRIAEEGQTLEEAAYKLARKFARGPAFAYRCQKEIFNAVFYPERGRYTALECEMLEKCSKHPDFKEAVNAFLEKRRPEFGREQ